MIKRLTSLKSYVTVWWDWLPTLQNIFLMLLSLPFPLWSEPCGPTDVVRKRREYKSNSMASVTERIWRTCYHLQKNRRDHTNPSNCYQNKWFQSSSFIPLPGATVGMEGSLHSRFHLIRSTVATASGEWSEPSPSRPITRRSSSPLERVEPKRETRDSGGGGRGHVITSLDHLPSHMLVSSSDSRHRSGGGPHGRDCKERPWAQPVETEWMKWVMWTGWDSLFLSYFHLNNFWLSSSLHEIYYLGSVPLVIRLSLHSRLILGGTSLPPLVFHPRFGSHE